MKYAPTLGLEVTNHVIENALVFDIKSNQNNIANLTE